MTTNNAQKPSLIVMLAPLAIVLLGYQFFFHADIQRDLKTRKGQAETARPSTGGRSQASIESARVFEKMKSVNQEIEQAETELEDVESLIAAHEERRRQLLAIVLGHAGHHSGPVGQRDDFQGALATASGPVTSALEKIHSMTSPVVTGGDAIDADLDRVVQAPNAANDTASAMMWVCEICDHHGLRRISNHISRHRGQESFNKSEREELAELLGERLPELVYFELELEGSFLDVIEALHQISQRLPMVTIQSLSMELAESGDATRHWRLSLGFTEA